MPLDDRLRDGLRRDADSIVADTDRHLATVAGRARVGTSATVWLVAAAAAVVVIAMLILGILPRTQVTRPGATDAPTPGASFVTPPGLEGTAWTVTLLASDPGVADLGMAGGWTLRLGEDSSLVVGTPNGFQTSRSAPPSRTLYALTDGEFLTTLFAPDFGPSCAGSGEFQVAIGPGRLVLTGTDTCQPRDVLLTTHPWSAVR